jgi:hypothetical protein
VRRQLTAAGEPVVSGAELRVIARETIEYASGY